MPYKDPAKAKEWFITRSKERRQLIQQIKLSRGCADCGYNKHHAALQFDHVPGRKYQHNSLGFVLGSTLKKLLDELDLLDVVCSNCHSIRTFDRGQFGNKY